jgi:hypothetical protein
MFRSDFKDTVKARADRDPDFRKALVAEALNCFAAGDVATVKVLLRDYIKGRALSDWAIGPPRKS